MMAECIPLIRAMARGRYAITMGGSWGKGTADHASDFDFRLYLDEIGEGASFWQMPEWRSFAAAVDRWRERGIDIDHVWVRTVGDMEAGLEAWLDGRLCPDDLVWTIWGYHLLPDLYHQHIIEDPFGIVAGWKERLRVYPPKLKEAIVRKHLESLRYWRTDYHYANKVKRGDVVFLAGLSARLVHDVMQVLFGLNEVYFVGDGSNLSFADRFAIVPDRLRERVEGALYPEPGADRFIRQRETLIGLIDDVERLATEAGLALPA